MEKNTKSRVLQDLFTCLA